MLRKKKINPATSGTNTKGIPSLTMVKQIEVRPKKPSQWPRGPNLKRIYRYYWKNAALENEKGPRTSSAGKRRIV
jgi:hypothetical protein